MTLPELCIRRPVFTTMLMVLPIVMGLIGMSRMGVDQLPNVDFPFVVVTVTRPGASVEEMEVGVTKPIEEAINTVGGIDEMISNTKEGITQIRTAFVLEKDGNIAHQEVQAKINGIIAILPTGTDTPIVDKFDLNSAPIMTLAVSGQRNIREVTEIADKVIREDLSRLPGVGSVTLAGGAKRAIQIKVDPDLMRGLGISIDQVQRALAEQNIEIPGGRVDQATRELSLRTMGRLKSVRDFNELIIANIGEQPIRLKDIGEARDDVEEPRSLARLDGNPTVSLTVLKQSGQNTIDVIKRVKTRMAELKEELAVAGRGDIEIATIRDQSAFIEGSIEEVQKHLLLGAILVSLTILFFLRDWRTMIIASISIPVSIIGTFLAMYWAGITINIISMVALVMAVGIVIDDAVVVHENIFRWMEEKGYSAWDAALAATKEIALAVLATTFSLVVIFVPIAFMSGIVGRFFKSFGLTMAFAIMVSLLVSFTLTPMLCSRFLKLSKKAKDAAARGDHSHHSGGIYGWLAEKPYMWSLRVALRHRWAVVLAGILVVMSMFPLPVGTLIGGKDDQGQPKLAYLNWPGLVGLVGQDFLPNDDWSEFDITLSTPAGWTLDKVSAITSDIEGRLRQMPNYEVKRILTTIGDTTGRASKGASGDVTQATIYVRIPDLIDRTALDNSTGFMHAVQRVRYWLHPPTRKYSSDDVMTEARKVLADYPDLRVAVATQGGQTDVEAILVGPQADKLGEYAQLILAELRQVPGLTDVDTTMPLRKPEMRVVIDRNRARDMGLNVTDIANALRTFVGGQIVSDFKDDSVGEQYDVWLRADADIRATREAIETMTVNSPTVGLVQLTSVAQLVEAQGPAQIDRYNRQRKITIVANTEALVRQQQFLFFKWLRKDKLPTSDAIARLLEIEKELHASGKLPLDYRITFSGRAKVMAESVMAFFGAFGLSLILMYMILAAQFESFLHPITILLAVPITVPFAFMSALLLDQSMNLYAILGVFLLFGVVKKNGILQVDYANQMRRAGLGLREAVLEANKVRLRPILMTTVMLVAGMIPLALGVGPGAGTRSSMAKIIIGGQALSLLLTLLITPVAYTLFDDIGRITKRIFTRKKSIPPTTPAESPELAETR